MKALVKFKRGKDAIEVQDVPMPEIGPDEVLIRNVLAGICSSDPKVIWQGWDEFDELAKRVIVPPVVVGAENFGEIVEVGKNVKGRKIPVEIGKDVEGWKVGDRVCVEVLQNNCEQCYWCRAGFKPMCPSATSLGRTFNGAFAEYYKSMYMYLHRVPKHVAPEDAVCTEMCAAVCTNLIKWTEIRPGDVVVVLGPGTIGQMAAQIARVRGAGTVVVTGTTHSEPRLRKAKELGANLTINQDKEDPVEIVKELTNGRGADIVVGACHAVETINQALEMVRRCGTICQIGAHNRESVPVKWANIFMKNLVIHGSDYHDWESWERAISMLASGQVKGAPLVSHNVSIDNWRVGYQAVLDDVAVTKGAIHP